MDPPPGLDLALPPFSLLDAAGLEQVQTVVDLEGRDRVSLGRRPGRSLWD